MLRAAAPTSALSAEAPGDDAVERERQNLLRSFWRSAGGFWGPRGTPASWLLCAALLVIILGNLAASYGMNLWHRGVFDALQGRDSDTVVLLSTLYLPLLGGASSSPSCNFACA